MIKKLKLLFRNPDCRLVFWLLVAAFACLALYHATGVFTSEVSAQQPAQGSSSGKKQMRGSAGLADVVGCNSSAAFSAGFNQTTLLIAGVPGESLYICAILATPDTTGTGKLVSGTGTLCGTGTADMTGAMEIFFAHKLHLGSGLGYIMKAPIGEDICMTTGGGAAFTGMLWFTAF